MTADNQQLVFLELSSAGELLQGGVGAQFNKLIAQAVADIRARLNDKKARKINLEISMVPKTESTFDEVTKTTHTELIGVGVTFAFDIKVPKRQTMSIDCGIDDRNRLLHNPHSPANHAQTVLLKADDPHTVKMDRKTAAGGA